MMEDYDDILQYTVHAERTLDAIVNSASFQDSDSELIFAALEKKLKCHSFGDYLKRYLYRKFDFGVPYKDVELKAYQQVIFQSFCSFNTPKSFEPTSAKLSALSKNWLTQQSVNRKVVFLLGFGLGMNVDEVNSFLTKVLQEQGYNPRDPFEVICWYCQKYDLGFSKFQELWELFAQNKSLSSNDCLIVTSPTVVGRDVMAEIKDEASLFAFLQRLKTNSSSSLLSATTGMYFNKLLARAKSIVADMYNKEQAELHAEEINNLRDVLVRSDKLSDAQILRRLDEKKSQINVYTAEDITESDLEHIISSAIPIDKNGNLSPSRKSKLHYQFLGKRFNRQRINDIVKGAVEASRFDLITLNFFVLSQDSSLLNDEKKRSIQFVTSTNRILTDCGYSELYVGNPYECFILMCMLSVDPLGTYADVWEISYNDQP